MLDEYHENLLENLAYFYPYIKKNATINELNLINKFSNFNEIYTNMRVEYKNEYSWHTVCRTLIYGLKENIISEDELDELLFRLMENSLFNSYLFRIDSHNIDLTDTKNFTNQLSEWNLSSNNQILNSIGNKSTNNSNYLICGYRQYNNKEVSALRLLLIDDDFVKIHAKNADEYHLIHPTIVEFDFERSLIHIRLRDVDNIESDSEEINTIRGRIDRTLRFISELTPSIKYSKFRGFRKSLFLLEEHILKPKRSEAQSKLETFKPHIDEFVNLINSTFTPPLDVNLTADDYVSNAVLSTISTTLSQSELGDIVGLRFRNSKEEATTKYAEVTIQDRGFKCVSSDDLYWLNLPILLDQKSIESLKIAKSLEQGFVIFSLTFSLETVNLKLFQRSEHPDKELERAPSDEKYSDVVSFLLPFL